MNFLMIFPFFPSRLVQRLYTTKKIQEGKSSQSGALIFLLDRDVLRHWVCCYNGDLGFVLRYCMGAIHHVLAAL